MSQENVSSYCQRWWDQLTESVYQWTFSGGGVSSQRMYLSTSLEVVGLCHKEYISAYLYGDGVRSQKMYCSRSLEVVVSSQRMYLSGLLVVGLGHSECFSVDLSGGVISSQRMYLSGPLVVVRLAHRECIGAYPQRWWDQLTEIVSQWTLVVVLLAHRECISVDLSGRVMSQRMFFMNLKHKQSFIHVKLDPKMILNCLVICTNKPNQMRFSRLPIRLQIHVVDVLYSVQFLTVSHFVYNFISYHVDWHACRHDRLLAHIFFYEGQICYVPVTICL